MTTKKAATPPAAPPLLNLDTMTIDEVIWFEEASGLAIDQIFDGAGKMVAPRGRVMKGAAYVVLKQADPAATIDQAGGTKLADVRNLASRPPMSPSDGD